MTAIHDVDFKTKNQSYMIPAKRKMDDNINIDRSKFNHKMSNINLSVNNDYKGKKSVQSHSHKSSMGEYLNNSMHP